MTRPTRSLVVTAVVAVAVGLSVERGETHKPITSKYTYNEDVFPILRERCGRCHVPDGVAPMSLMSYQEAFPWGESVRAEVIAKHMPPWHVEESAVRFKNQPTITSTEIDKILVWVSGSYPQGNPQNVPPRVTLHHDWPIGKPDVVLPLTEVTLDPDTNEITKEFTVATGFTQTTWVRAVDLLPGTPAIVRDALVSIKRPATGNASRVTDADVLAAWIPGEDPVDADGGAFKLPPRAELVVRVHYKKTFSYVGRDMRTGAPSASMSPRGRRTKSSGSSSDPGRSSPRRSRWPSVRSSTRICSSWPSGRPPGCRTWACRSIPSRPPASARR
jgi:hypothetical protein